MVMVVAEAGINHMGNLETAKELAKAAKECGCDAVKFQTYKAETRVEPGSKLFDILKFCELTYKQQEELKKYCDDIDIEFFSTPFDTESLKFLIDIGVKRIKIASFYITNKEFLKEVDKYKTNVIMSTGMANMYEIFNAVCCLRNSNITLLHCVSAYPTPEDKVNLAAIEKLKDAFFIKYKVGYSDHTAGIRVPALAVIAGAEVIEKHFTLDLNNGAVDNPVSADPTMMRELIANILRYKKIYGSFG